LALSLNLQNELCGRLKPGARIASFGYPDIIAPPSEIARLLGDRINQLHCREDSEQIGKWHGVQHPIPDAYSFFNLLLATLDVYDVAQHRGGEIIADLNEPLRVVSEYDFVIDVGTIEHCFNIGQAALNMAGMLKAGGFILHENPFAMGNHGFYSINPTWYADFYGQQGFKLHECWLVAKENAPVKNVERTSRFMYQGPEANCIAIAERLEVLPITWPHQSKYKKMITAAAAAHDAGGSGAKEKAHA